MLVMFALLARVLVMSNVYTSLHVIYWTRNAIIAVNDPLYFRWMIVF